MSKPVQIRLPEPFYATIQRLAEEKSLTLSTFVRSALFSTLNETDKALAHGKGEETPRVEHKTKKGNLVPKKVTTKNTTGKVKVTKPRAKKIPFGFGA